MAKKNDPVSKYLSDIGRRGGEAQVKKGTAMLTQEQRKELGKKAAAARWGPRKKKPKAKTGKGKADQP